MAETLTARTVRGGALTFGAILVSRLLGTVGMIYLVRTLTPEDFGLFTVAVSAFSTLELMSGLGSGHAIVQSPSKPKDLGVAALSISSTAGLLLYTLAVQYSEQISILLGTERLSSVLVYLAPLVLAHSMTVVPAAFLQKDMLFGRRAVVTVVSELANTCVAVFAAATGHGMWSLVYGALSRALSRVLLSWPLSRPQQWFRLAMPQWTMIKGLLSFGGQSTVFGALVFFTNAWHNLLVGKVLGPTAVGYYSRAFAFATMPLDRGVQMLAGPLFPAYSKLQHDKERLKHSYLRSIQVLSLVTFPAVLGLCAVSEEFVYAVLGATWAPMITTLQVLAIMNVFVFFPMAASPLYLATGVPRYNVMVSAIEAVSTVSFTLIAVRYGILWVGIASAVARALGAAYSLKALDGILPGILSGLFRMIRPPLLGCAVMMLGIWAARPHVQGLFSNPHGVGAFVSFVLMGAALYVAAVLLVDRKIITVARDIWRSSRPGSGRP